MSSRAIRGDGESLDRVAVFASSAQEWPEYLGLSTSSARPLARAEPFTLPPRVSSVGPRLTAAPLIVITARDPSIPPPNAEGVVKLSPDAALVCVDGFGHTALPNSVSAQTS